MGRRGLLCTGLLLVTACGPHEPSGGRVASAPDGYRLDFGAVPVGADRTLTLAVANPGGNPGAIQVMGVLPPFEGPAAPVAVRAGRTTVEVTFHFRPTRAATEAMSVRLIGPFGERTAVLAGAGTPPSIRCAPLDLDLGIVLAPGEAEAAIRCTSDLDERVALHVGPFDDPSGRFARLLSLPDGDTLLLPAHGFADARVHLSATVTGDLLASLPIVQQAAGVRYDIGIRARLVDALLDVLPDSLDFGPVEPGDTRVRAVTLVNLGSSPIALALRGPADRPPFAIQLPATLPPDDPATPAQENAVSAFVRFAPQSFGAVQAVFDIDVTGQGVRPRLQIPVGGLGGGPRLACDGPLDFGPVALGVSYPATVLCRNLGVNGASLTVSSASTGSTEFVVDGNPRRTLEGWAIDLLFSPSVEGPRNASLKVVSNGGVEAVQLSGEGQRFDDCDFEVQPVRGLDFGTVEPGRSMALDITVRNRGGKACLVRDVQLSAASSPLYSIAPRTVVEIAPGGDMVVPVTFSAGTGLGRATGTLDFWISRPGASRQHVPLTADVASGCLRFEPTLLDLGRVPIGCRGTAGTVVVRNTCRNDVVITGLGLASTASTSFELVSPPQVSFAVPAGGGVPLGVAYRAAQQRLERGGILLRTSAGAEYVAAVQGRGLARGEPLDRFLNSRAVDVLLVVDDSQQMSSERDSLSALGGRLAAALDDRAADFHLGVTGTSMLACTDPTVPVPDARLLPLSGLRIVTRATPGFASTFAGNAAVPTCSGEAAALEAALTAISPPLSTSDDDTRHGDPFDGNAGFLRPAAELALLFVSSMDDHSSGSVDDYVRDLIALGRARTTAHAIAPPAECDGSGRLQEAVSSLGGTFRSFCDGGWSSATAATELARSIAPDRLRYVPSSAPPDLDGDGRITEPAGEISVTIAGLPVPSSDALGPRWSFVNGGLEFEATRPPPPGASIGLRYGLFCE